MPRIPTQPWSDQLSPSGLNDWRTNFNLAPGVELDSDCIKNRNSIPKSSFRPFDSFPSFQLYPILQQYSLDTIKRKKIANRKPRLYIPRGCVGFKQTALWDGLPKYTNEVSSLVSHSNKVNYFPHEENIVTLTLLIIQPTSATRFQYAWPLKSTGNHLANASLLTQTTTIYKVEQKKSSHGCKAT